MVAEQNLLAIIGGAVLVGGLSLIWFFVRGYFNNLSTLTKENTKAYHSLGKLLVKVETKLDDQSKDIARLEGAVNQMARDSHRATEAIYQAKMELKALWRYADKDIPHGRASDRQ